MHNLDQSADGAQTAFASAREHAWHRLGTVTDASMTSEQAMELAHLKGWDVRKRPLMAVADDGSMIELGGRAAVLRTSPFDGKPEALGVVGERYQPIQNEEHAALLDTLVDESGAHFETAGAIDGGRKVFLSMRLPGHITIGGVDPVTNYLVAVNSHDGSSAFTLMVTPVRVVCQNTLAMAYGRHSHAFRVRHTSGALNAVSEARAALDMSFTYLEEFQASAEAMIQSSLTQSRFDAIIAAEWGAGDDAPAATQTRATARLDVMSGLFTASTQKGIDGTVWGGFNALTEYFDHYQPTRGEEHAEDQRALRAALFPWGKRRALELMQAEV
jgi:phage/plasmid-like protein (TIGR03299 family)